MKEAAGEANITVITIVLIAIVLAVGTIIVRNVMSTTGESSACSSAGGTWRAGACYHPRSCSGEGATFNCKEKINCTKTNGEWTCEGTTK